MNRVTSLFGIRYPIIQGGMVWCSGWRLAAAVSNGGRAGLARRRFDASRNVAGAYQEMP